jgi:hypothetical protein
MHEGNEVSSSKEVDSSPLKEIYQRLIHAANVLSTNDETITCVLSRLIGLSEPVDPETKEKITGPLQGENKISEYSALYNAVNSVEQIADRLTETVGKLNHL